MSVGEAKPDPNGPLWAAYWITRILDAQEITHVHVYGVPFARIAWGDDYPDGKLKCPDCGVSHGQLHVPKCCIERCAVCLSQALWCPCTDENCADGEDDEEQVGA